jgi:AraC-like DNA-binding protein
VEEFGVTTQRHQSELGWMEIVSGTPAPSLRAHVRRYCGYGERASHAVRRRELPSADVTLILSLGPELRLLEPYPARHTSFVAGLDERSTVTEHDGEATGVEVNLSPLGAHLFLRVPMHTLTRRVVELDDVLGREADRLVQRLHDTPTWPERFQIVDDAVRARIADAPEPSPGVGWAWQQLLATAGRVRVEALASELGWSRKRLVAGFREEIGLPPKTLARILRFRRAVRLLERDDGLSLGEIALDCGYFDQAHLNHDFRSFAGSTPSDLLARRFPEPFGIRPE